jgi:hypothetical protein
MTKRTLAEFFEGIKLEEPRFLRNLVIYPLSNGGKSNPKIKVLDDALKEKNILISELANAQIEQVRLQNRSDYRVFVLDGEEITGAWQNRITTTAAFIDTRSEVLLPTSCVEQGRWTGDKEFTIANSCSFPSLRAVLCKDVTNSLTKTRTFKANQERIWQSIGNKLDSLKVQSMTSSMHDIFQRLKAELARFSESAGELSQFTGMIAACGEKIICIDLFGYKNIFARLAPKLLESYGLDALEKMNSASEPPTNRIEKLISQLKRVQLRRFPSVGLGDELRFQSTNVLGRALIFGNDLLHFSAFPKQN